MRWRRTRAHRARAPAGFVVHRPPLPKGTPAKAARSCAQKQSDSSGSCCCRSGVRR